MQSMIDRATEDHSQWLHTITCSTEPRLVCCPMCECEALDSDEMWRLPHPCAMTMHEDMAYICDSETCLEDWGVINFDHIDDYELRNGI